MYEVQQIVSKRINPTTNQIEYRVKWVNYPPEDNTWEPEKNLTFVKQLIEKFNKKGEISGMLGLGSDDRDQEAKVQKSGNRVKKEKASAIITNTEQDSQQDQNAASIFFQEQSSQKSKDDKDSDYNSEQQRKPKKHKPKPKQSKIVEESKSQKNNEVNQRAKNANMKLAKSQKQKQNEKFVQNFKKNMTKQNGIFFNYQHAGPMKPPPSSSPSLLTNLGNSLNKKAPPPLPPDFAINKSKYINPNMIELNTINFINNTQPILQNGKNMNNNKKPRPSEGTLMKRPIGEQQKSYHLESLPSQLNLANRNIKNIGSYNQNVNMRPPPQPPLSNMPNQHQQSQQNRMRPPPPYMLNQRPNQNPYMNSNGYNNGVPPPFPKQAAQNNFDYQSQPQQPIQQHQPQRFHQQQPQNQQVQRFNNQNGGYQQNARMQNHQNYQNHQNPQNQSIQYVKQDQQQQQVMPQDNKNRIPRPILNDGNPVKNFPVQQQQQKQQNVKQPQQPFYGNTNANESYPETRPVSVPAPIQASVQAPVQTLVQASVQAPLPMPVPVPVQLSASDTPVYNYEYSYNYDYNDQDDQIKQNNNSIQPSTFGNGNTFDSIANMHVPKPRNQGNNNYYYGNVQQPEVQVYQVFNMEKNKQTGSYAYLCNTNQGMIWVPRHQIVPKFSTQLVIFYQKHLTLEQQQTTTQEKQDQPQPQVQSQVQQQKQLQKQVENNNHNDVASINQNNKDIACMEHPDNDQHESGQNNTQADQL